MTLDAALDYARSRTPQTLADLMDWVRIPSISSLSSHAAEMQQAAEWAAARLRRAGLADVRILPTTGHPLVFAQWLDAGPAAPTVLLYGHYDVQPALDPAAWDSPPFEPQVRGERLYGRGTSDMKGQALAMIAALEAILQTAGRLPVNLKVLIEGEEEIGSRHLRAFIQANRELLACDYAFNPDAGMLAPDTPSVAYALRGGLRMDLTVFGPRTDVHSGTFGGTLHNPAQALAEILAGLHDEAGRVTLPGFYDKVRPISPEEHEELNRLRGSSVSAASASEFYLQASGAPALWGDPDFTPVERTTARPTLEVLAMHAGLPGEGVLNIVPAKAMAALSFRLVPFQEPADAAAQLRGWLETHVPPTVRWELTQVGAGGRGVLVDRDSAGVRAISQAYQDTWGVAPAFIRLGGGIPVVAQLQEELGVQSVLTGFALPDDAAHGPNEHLHLPTWRSGILALVRFFHHAAAAPPLQQAQRPEGAGAG